MKFNVPEKYIHVETTQAAVDSQLLVKITCDLIPNNSLRLTINEKSLEKFMEVDIIKYVTVLTYGYSEYELRKTFLQEDVNEEDFEVKVDKKLDFHRTLIVESKGVNPFRKNSKAFEQFKSMVIGITVNDNHKLEHCAMSVMRSAYKKGKIVLVKP